MRSLRKCERNRKSLEAVKKRETQARKGRGAKESATPKAENCAQRWARKSGKVETKQQRIFNRISVIAGTAAGFSESEGMVKDEGRLVRSADFEQNFGDSRRLKIFD